MTKKHYVYPPRNFDQLSTGEQFLNPSRTITEAQLLAFQAVSGDNHPIHYDIEYCRARGHRGLLAHGYQILSTAAIGAGPLAHVIGESLIGFTESSNRFLKGVYAGDTLYPQFTIKELIKQRSTGVVVVDVEISNQLDEMVLEGEQRYLLKLK